MTSLLDRLPAKVKVPHKIAKNYRLLAIFIEASAMAARESSSTNLVMNFTVPRATERSMHTCKAPTPANCISRTRTPKQPHN